MSRSSGSWRRRQRLASIFNVLLSAGAVIAAALTTEPGDWGPPGLLIVLAVSAIASDVLVLRVRKTPTPQLRDTTWSFSSSAPFVLAAVFLGPAPVVAMGLVAVVVSAIPLRTSPWDVLANAAQYSFHLLTAAWLVELAVSALELSQDDPAFILLVVGAYVWVLMVSDLLNAVYGAFVYGESIPAHFESEWKLQLFVECPIMLMTGLAAYVYATSGLVALAALAGMQLVFVVLARELRRSYERAAALRQHAQQISELSASRSRLVDQILSAEEGERRRLADMLHNDAMQNLLAARQDLAGDFIVDPERSRAALDATIEQLRDAIFELHPAVFDHVGLAVAVEATANRAAHRGRFETSVEVSVCAADAERDTLLFTVVRELLANAAQHSRASRVSVRIREVLHDVLVEVSDDGCGFPPQRRHEALEMGHIGLASIAERIEAFGGTFNVDSHPDLGTLATVRVPRQRDETPEGLVEAAV
jgi:signal transduction histidine kinase